MGDCKFTGQPYGTAPEASPGPDHLPSLAAADMVGLIHHVGRPVEILQKKNACSARSKIKWPRGSYI